MKYIISILMVLSLTGMCYAGVFDEFPKLCGFTTQDTVTEWETVSRTTLEHCGCPTCAVYCSTVCNQEGTEYLITRLHVGYNGMRQKFIIKKERTSTPVQHKSEACWDNYYYRGTVN